MMRIGRTVRDYERPPMLLCKRFDLIDQMIVSL